MEDAFAIGAPIGVCAEVIALGLGEIGRQTFTAIGIKIGQGSRYCQHGDAQANSRLQHFPPRRLMVTAQFAEGIIEQQVGQFGSRSNAEVMSLSSPARIMQPARQMRSNSGMFRSYLYSSDASLSKSKPLGIGGDLAGIQGLLRQIQSAGRIAGEW